jgi:hypothetical protein
MFTSRGGSRTFNIEAPGPGMQPGSRDLQHNSEHISIQPNPNNLHADIQDALNEKCQELANNASTRVYTTWRHEGVGANLDCSYREISNQGQDEITKMEMTCYPGQTGTRIQCSYGMDMRREVTTTPNRTSRTLPLLGVAIERLSPAPRAPLPQTQSTAPQASINRLSIAISEYKEEANRTIQIHNHREERTVSTATPQNFREMATSWMRDNCRASTAAANRAQNAPPEPAPAPADAR